MKLTHNPKSAHIQLPKTNTDYGFLVDDDVSIVEYPLGITDNYEMLVLICLY